MTFQIPITQPTVTKRVKAPPTDLNPVICGERHLLRDLYVDRVSSSVLHHKGVGVCNDLVLGEHPRVAMDGTDWPTGDAD